MTHLPLAAPLRCDPISFVLRALLGVGLLLLSRSDVSGQSCGWRSVAPCPEPKMEAFMLAIDDHLVSFGGLTTSLRTTRNVHVYNPRMDLWLDAKEMPASITHYAMARDDRLVFMIGGFVGGARVVTSDVWIYHVDLNDWFPGPPLPQPRASGGAFVLGRELHYVSGLDTDRNTDRDDHWVLDLDNLAGGWTADLPIPIARNHFGAISLNGVGYVIGGQFRHDSSPQDIDSVYAFEPGRGWYPRANLPIPRSHFEPSTFTWEGKIVIAGGRSNVTGVSAVNVFTEYDPVLDRWTDVGVIPGPRVAPGAKVIGSYLYLTGGGESASQPESANSVLALRDGIPPRRYRRINVGGGRLDFDDTWCPDRDFLNGRIVSTTQGGDIAGTLNDELYWSERRGMPRVIDYEIPVPSGPYRVRLHFAELFWNGPGRRVFDVRLEGQVVLDNYDIYADVGARTAAVRSFVVDVSDGRLNLQLEASADEPKLCGYEIFALSDAVSPRSQR